MACVVILEVAAKEGQSEALLQAFRDILGDTRAYDGNQGLELVRDQDAPEKFIAYEKWDSRAHYEKYFNWRQESGTLAKIGELLAGPPSIRYFEITDA